MVTFRSYRLGTGDWHDNGAGYKSKWNAMSLSSQLPNFGWVSSE